MISLKIKKKDKEKERTYKTPEYRWNTEFTLEKDEISDVGLSMKECSVGDEVTFVIKTKIKSMEISENALNENKTMAFQITNIAKKDKKKDEDNSAVGLYE